MHNWQPCKPTLNMHLSMACMLLNGAEIDKAKGIESKNYIL